MCPFVTCLQFHEPELLCDSGIQLYVFITSEKTSLLYKKQCIFVLKSIRLMACVKGFISRKKATISCIPFHLGTSAAGSERNEAGQVLLKHQSRLLWRAYKKGRH